MKRINEQRPKAFIGAAISVGTSIVSGIIGNRKKKKAEQAERLRQERLQNLQNHQALASAQNENMMSEEERSQFLSQYLSKGGGVKTSPRKGVKARIVEGGTAIPIKKDSFLLKGRKHNTGGIVIDAGKTGVEAEGGEVVQVTPKQLKVFSAQPILNGNSPAELVQKGAEPSKVFNAQEEFKDKNNLNDDGTKNNSKMKNGGIRKIYPSLSGRYYGKNEGRAIRSLREARSNPNYQYNGNNIPSMPSLNSELKPIKREEPVKKEVSKPKKQSFSSAFVEARRQGLKVFEWNGKKYGTQLASEVTKKPKKQSFSSAFVEARRQGLKVFEWNGKKYGTQLASEVTKKPITNKVEPKVTKETKIEPKTKTKVQTIEREFPEVVITAPRKKQSTLNNNVSSNKVEPKSSKTNIIPEVNVVGSRIPKMIKDNTFVPSQYSSNNNNITVPRESTSVSLYKGIKSILGVPERRRKKLGGLSRSKDYGSDKKPYPSVKSNDFAGGGRSYPIPTKADARDALRLAGLHGRSDVRAKVYKKYPELKKSALGSKTKLLKDNYNNFGLEKDYSNSFAPNVLTKANMNSVKTNSVVPTKPVGASISSSTSPLSKSGSFKNFMSGIGGEAISAGIGALGNIISGVTNKNSINNIQAPTRPRTVVPARMRTTYNINPQLAESRDSERNMARLIDSNTSSSSGKIARIQSLANRGVLERNKLRGMKENVETDLLNRSTLNRQGVEAANNQMLNAYDNAVTQTENEKIQARANNRTNVIEGLTSAVRDYQLGVDKRRSEENATAAMMSANPEQMELFLKLMNKNKSRLSNIRSTLFKCGGKKKIA